MSTWNHRVIRTPSGSEDDPWYYAIHEVHYDGERITSWTQNPVHVGASEGIDGLSWVLDKMRECLSKPILEVCEDGNTLREVKPDVWELLTDTDKLNASHNPNFDIRDIDEFDD